MSINIVTCDEYSERLAKGLTITQALGMLREMVIEAIKTRAYGTFSIRIGPEGVDVKQETSKRFPSA